MIDAILKKFFLEFWRNKISVGLVFVFPLFFLFIFNLAFSGNVINTTTSYNIALINLDEGIPEAISYPQLPQNWRNDGVGANLSDIIFDVKYDGNNSETIPIFKQHLIKQSEIDTSIADGDLTLVLIIPNNFSLTMLNLINNKADLLIPNWPVNMNETFTIYGDERSQSFSVANSIILSIINTFVKGVAEGDSFSSGDVQIKQEIVLPLGDNLNIFDIIAPGIFVFATILSAAYFSAMIIADEEKGMMSRIKISLVNPRSYVGAFMILAFGIMIVQALTLFAASYWIFGFHPIGSFANALLVLALLSMATFGLVFTVGALVKSSDTAGSAIGMVSSIIGFASGSFMPMPKVVLIKGILPFTSGSADFLLWDIFPWTHANNALRAILLFDQSLSDVAGDLLLLLTMGLLWMLLGIRLFSKRRFGLRD